MVILHTTRTKVRSDSSFCFSVTSTLVLKDSFVAFIFAECQHHQKPRGSSADCSWPHINTVCWKTELCETGFVTTDKLHSSHSWMWENRRQEVFEAEEVILDTGLHQHRSTRSEWKGNNLQLALFSGCLWNISVSSDLMWFSFLKAHSVYKWFIDSNNAIKL